MFSKQDRDVLPDRHGWRKLWLVASVAGCVAITLCVWLQPDWLAPISLVPAWCWFIAGVLLTACGYHRDHRWRFIAVLGLWGIFMVLFVEQAHSLLRVTYRPPANWQAMREEGRGLRIVSLNCGAGRARSAQEVAVWNPDIVLLQESPGSMQIERLCQELFGAKGMYLHGGDTSIVARGQIQQRVADRRGHFVHALVLLSTGVRTEVISARLDPPEFRLDFWRRGFWVDHRRKRLKHRRQILDIMKQVEAIPAASHLIVGGDLNSPTGDGALAPLKQRLVDTFQQGGRGWGSTGTNKYPLFRVDQIWASRGLRAESVTAQKTLHSDHRMVVCDLVLIQ